MPTTRTSLAWHRPLACGFSEQLARSSPARSSALRSKASGCQRAATVNTQRTQSFRSAIPGIEFSTSSRAPPELFSHERRLRRAFQSNRARQQADPSHARYGRGLHGQSASVSSTGSSLLAGLLALYVSHQLLKELHNRRDHAQDDATPFEPFVAGCTVVEDVARRTCPEDNRRARRKAAAWQEKDICREG